MSGKFNKELFLKNFEKSLINAIVKEIEKKKKSKTESLRARYMEPDGRFKVMTNPKNPKEKGRFWGCVRYFMAQGKSYESAVRLCAYIKNHVKKSSYKELRKELQADVELCKSLGVEFDCRALRMVVEKMFYKALANLKDEDELDDVEKMLVAGWMVLRRFK